MARSVKGPANAASSNVATVPAKNEPMAAVASATPARPRRAHLVTVQRGHHRGRLARQVDQNRGGRAAVLRAVIDAREHDQRRHRRQRVGRGQQHGNGRHRPQARQHPDQRAQQATHEGVQQVLKCQGGGETQRQVFK